ncbi:MAG: hypothetical protein WKF34_00115 [Pyrinomonadaceae bacterium]
MDTNNEDVKKDINNTINKDINNTNKGTGTDILPVKPASITPTAFAEKAPNNAPLGTAGAATAQAKDTPGSFIDQAKAVAGDAYSSVADKATSTVEDGKAGLVTGLEGVAHTVRRVVDAIGEDGDDGKISGYAARYTETGAKKLEDIAGYFDKTDLKGMARDVERYGRQNPAIFLGAAFALGVLAARFLKSSPADSSETAAANRRESIDRS